MVFGNVTYTWILHDQMYTYVVYTYVYVSIGKTRSEPQRMLHGVIHARAKIIHTTLGKKKMLQSLTSHRG